MTVALTRGAEGFPRRAFSVDDIRRMIDAGVIGESERFELIEGEIVPMQAKSVAHDNIKHALTLALARAVPDGMYVGIEATIQLTKDVLLEPDIAIISRAVYKADPKSFAQPKAKDVLLLIEIAVSSLAFAYLLKPLGLVLASAALVFISAYGGHEFKWKEVTIMSAVLAAFSVAAFVYGLGLPMNVWPSLWE